MSEKIKTSRNEQAHTITDALGLVFIVKIITPPALMNIPGANINGT